MALDQSLLAELLNIFLLDLDAQSEALMEALLGLEQGMELSDLARQDQYAACMRSAHNLKGGARGLDLTEMVDVFHRLENRFEQMRDSQWLPDAKFIELCQSLLNGIRDIVKHRINGSDFDIDLEAITENIEQLPLGKQEPTDTRQPALLDTSAVEIADTTTLDSVQEADVPTAPPKEADSDSTNIIRIQQDRLEKISRLNDELMVTHSAYNSIKGRADAIRNEVGQSIRQLKSMYAFWNERTEHGTVGIEKLFTDALQRLANFEDEMHSLTSAMGYSGGASNRLSSAMNYELQKIRLVPAKVLLQPLMLSARSIAAELGKRVEITTSGEDISIDRLLIDRLHAPLGHILRNAIDHAIETPDERQRLGKSQAGNITIRISRQSGQIRFSISDDGCGMNVKAIAEAALERGILQQHELEEMTEQQQLALVFHSGLSTRERAGLISGRGVGMDEVNTMVSAMRGQINIETSQDQGTTIHIKLPLMLLRERGLIVQVARHNFILPSLAVERLITFHLRDIVEVEGGQAVLVDDEPVALRCLTQVLGLKPLQQDSDERMGVIVRHGPLRMAFIVSDVISEQNIIIKPLAEPLKQVPNIKGGSYDAEGNVVIVLDVTAILKQVTGQSLAQGAAVQTEQPVKQKQRVLVVDDSLTTRTLEKNVLEANGYEVAVCVNGRDALNRLESGDQFDIVVSDVEMPFMTGFELTSAIRANNALADLPVILVTSLAREEHRQMGMQAGADAYIVKSSFESHVLLDAIKRLIP